MAAGIAVQSSPLNNREVYWARYLDWLVTCPLLLWVFARVANEAVSRTLPTSRVVYTLATTAGSADGGSAAGDGEGLAINFTNLPPGYSGNIINGALGEDRVRGSRVNYM
jgi:hypothetical protein